MNNHHKGFRNLVVWMRKQELVILVYRVTKKLPADEKFGLTSQLRRAVVSVLSNFVEGYLKSSKKEKLVYLERSETSLLEIDAQIEVCFVLGFLNDHDCELFNAKRREVGYLLHQYKSKVF